MKIQCSACEVAEAAVLCCADEAALCFDCDRNIHAANKLARKHERIPLADPSSQMPNCDICQEMVGYFFCLEDRALLCRKCDVAIHTTNPYVSSHQRFLLTGVRFGLEPSKSSPASSMGNSTFNPRAPMPVSSHYSSMMSVKNEAGNLTPAKRSAPGKLSDKQTKTLSVQGGDAGEDTQSRLSSVDDVPLSSLRQWLSDDFVGLGEFNHISEYVDHGSSKLAHQAEHGKLGDSKSSLAMASEGNSEFDKCIGQEPDIAWSVPQVQTPFTTSELNCPKTELVDNSAFVPDIF